MSDVININKGLNLPISGTAERLVTDARCIRCYAIKPTDFVGLVPKLLVAEGDAVAAGDALFCDKSDARVRFTSPVSGTVKSVVRGEKRKLLAVVVEAAEEAGTQQCAAPANNDELRQQMLQKGLWTMLRQRPFGTVPNPDAKPKAIVVSCLDTAPLAVDYDYVLQGRENDFLKGLEVLASMTDGLLHLSFRQDQTLLAVAEKACGTIKNLRCHIVRGPHPAGNVGPQIAKFCPINKGDIVFTANPQDVATIGHFAATGEYRPEKVVAVAGPQVKKPQYYNVLAGAAVETLLKDQVVENSRIISGNVLSGTQIAMDGYLCADSCLISVLPEGNYYDFMGWLMPGFKKFSLSRTFLSGFTAKCRNKKSSNCKFDTNFHGSVRPFVFSGNFEQVFPFDIYPTQLIKACMIEDFELMENLGIYEVEPEDFALCEFIDPSKTDIQPVIREALEKLRKEAM